MVSERFLTEDDHKTKEQLLSELAILRQHVTELEQYIAEAQQSEQFASAPQPQAGKVLPKDIGNWRISLLQQLTASLASALTTAEIFEILLHQGSAALQATRGWVAQRDKDSETVELVKTLGYSSIDLEAYRQMSLSEAMPATDTIRTGQMVLVRSWQDYEQQYPALAKHFPKTQSVVALPLVIGSRVVGAIGWSFAQPQAFSETDCHFMITLARQCAQALERAHLYEAERLARETAEAANRVKDEFLTILSHELRSPLNPILGWTKMLRSRQFDPKMTDRALETIERNAKLQVQLIEDLLDVSHIFQGKLRLNISAVNLVVVVEAAMETVKLAAESKSISLQFLQDAAEFDAPMSGNAPAARLYVAGDAARLQQVIWNLISNAVKFTPTGGEVVVKLAVVTPDTAADIQVASSETASSETASQDSYAQITVTDTGRGIDPIFLPYIFDSFRQADSTITRQFGGLGLGLAIVRHLVELHGGTVRAESRGVDQGATFQIRLPLFRSSPAISSIKPLPPPVAIEQAHLLDQARILVVDDEADMREYVEVVLSSVGAQVALASSAGEALAKLPRFKPDILISDIGLPNVDGYALLRQIRTLVPELGGLVPAIALTAYAGEYNQQRVLAAGFQLHVAKPVEPEALVAAAASLMPQG